MNVKRCACCKRILPVECFTSNIRNSDGLHSYCKECNARKAKEFRERAGKDYINHYATIQRKNGYFRYGKGAYLNMMKSAEKRHIKFELTEDSLKSWWTSTPDQCFYCKCTISEYLEIRDFIENYNGDDELILYIKAHVFNKAAYYKIETMTIDRVDSSGPYSIGNIVKSCWICNSIKSNTIDADLMKKTGVENLKHIKEVINY